MIFLFTTRKSLFSTLIRKITGEDASHFAIYFPDHDIVLHSQAKGVAVEWFEVFRRKNDIIYALEYEYKNENVKRHLYETIVESYIDKPYDLGALLFWPVIIFAKQIFGFKYESNLWASKSAYLCVEIAEALKIADDNIFGVDWPESFDMITPYQLYKVMRKSKNLKETILD
jgi:hypothetical protein